MHTARTRLTRPTRPWLALWYGFSAACAAGGDDHPPPTTGTLLIGQADENGAGFEALSDGDSALLHFGPQGGYHLWLAFRTQEFEPSQVIFEVELWRDDLGVRAASTVRGPYDLEDVGDGVTFQTPMAGGQLILCPNPTGIGAAGRNARIFVLARDPLRRHISATVEVETVCPVADRQRCEVTCGGD